MERGYSTIVILTLILLLYVEGDVLKATGNGTCKCFDSYRPVCGTDHVTYRNDCELLCARRRNLKLRKLQDSPCVFERPP
ncbi:hypothetical protein CHUAL_013588 [Chamberlinius hualienensis]